MESQFLAVAVALSAILLTFFLIFLSPRLRGVTNLPPGTFGWPIIGESIEFLFGKPEIFVGDRMKKYSPDIFKTKILGEKTAVICGPKAHKFLFTNELKYFTAFRPHPMQHLFRSYKKRPAADESSKMIRQPGFLKPEALMRYLSKMDSISEELLETHWKGKEVIHACPFAKTLTLTLACHFFLGIQNPDRISKLVKYFDDITIGMHCIMINFPGTIFYRANKAAAFVRKELLNVISEKKLAMRDGGRLSPMLDILSHLISVTDPNGNSMPDNEIADKIMGLLTAGYSTVATAITFSLKYIGLNPKIYEKVRAEQMEIAAAKKDGDRLTWEEMGKMKYSWNVICETMRLAPPLQGTFREVLTEFSYGGYTVPKGWKVYWTVSTTNRNPAYFREPDKFNPARYDEGEAAAPYANVPFGGGPRTCPGKEYARLAMLSFLHNVVKKYRWEVLNPTEKVVGDMIPEPENGLPVRLFHC